MLIYDDKIMTLQINLSQSDITLKLLKNKRTIDMESLKYYHDLSNVLITGLDKLLRRNNIDIKLLKSYKILSNLGRDSTSYKIASAFIGGSKS